MKNSYFYNRCVSIREIKEIFEQFQLELSFWEALCIIETIKIKIKSPSESPDEFKVSFISL